MSAQARWAAIRPTEPSAVPNPGAGHAWAKPTTPRPEGTMTPMGTSARDWTPTVVNLLVLIVLEMVAYATLRYVFRTALGG